MITTPTSLIESITATMASGTTRRYEFTTETGPTLTSNNAEPTAIPTRAAAAIVTALYDARAIGYVEQRPDDTEPLATIKISARLNGPSESFTLLTDPESDDKKKPTVLARRSGEPVFLRIEQSVVAALLDPSVIVGTE